MTNNTRVAPTQLPKLYKPNVKQQQSFGICIYGRSGAGKTTLIGTMPGKGLIVDVPQVEGGTFVLEDKAANIDIVPVENWNEIEGIYSYLAHQPHEYKWVAIDSITGFQELAKRKVINERTLDADPHMIALQEYGKIGQLIGELVYRFRKLPVHTIWIAQERKHGGGDDGGQVIMGPDVIPSALSALLPSMMLVGRLSVYQDEEGTWCRQLRIGPHPDFYTKVRAKPGLDVPRSVKSPNLTTILRFLLGNGPAPEAAEEPSIVILG